MRNCDECQECCIEGQVKFLDFIKKANKKCPYQYKDGCSLFGQSFRPKECVNYFCSWARGYGEEEDRPDKCGLSISVNNFNNGIWIFARERRKNALETGKRILLDIANKIDIPIIVVDYKSVTPNDFGDYTVIKESLKHKSKSMMGELIKYLDDDKIFGLYKLIWQ